jgi:uncharacterized repeat protein (TIGR01451 family)
MKQWLGVILCAGLVAAGTVNPVRLLKAVDARGVQVYSGQWQNKTKTVTFTWKAPYSDQEIKGYRYSFGLKKTTPDKDLTETFVTLPLQQDGVYYFSVAALDVDKTVSEPKTFEVWYSTKQPDNTLEVAVINPAQPVLSFTKPATMIPVKGILYYVGTNQQGVPNQFTLGKTVVTQFAGNTTNYVVAAIEDEAGNVSKPKVVTSFVPTQKISTEPARIKIQARQTAVKNADPKDQEVKPGSTVEYTITLVNEGNTSGYGIDVKDTIPIGTTIVLDSLKASGKVRFEYFDTSLNAGNGAWTTVVDEPNAVTQVRWILTEPLDAGKKIDLAYSVVVGRV